MAYDQEPASTALDTPNDESAETPQEESSEDESPEGKFYLPGDFPGAETLKAGDTVTLRVCGKDAEGDIEVEHVNGDSGDGSKPIMQDFDESMK